MANPDFEPVSISKSLGTKAKIAKLTKLMIGELPGQHRIYVYQAIDKAIEEAIEARQPASEKKNKKS